MTAEKQAESVYVVLDDVTPMRGTVTRIGPPGIEARPGEMLCHWIGDEAPTKGMRAWHWFDDFVEWAAP